MISWEVLYGVGALFLAVAIGWGLWSYHSRNRANDRLTDAATRAEYKHPETYDRTEEELRKQIRPS